VSSKQCGPTSLLAGGRRFEHLDAAPMRPAARDESLDHRELGSDPLTNTNPNSGKSFAGQQGGLCIGRLVVGAHQRRNMSQSASRSGTVQGYIDKTP
jgi:hypothetical protein